ncbi:MAG: hypothetical protein AUJ92_17565 [Armatimonadetes bacterium CG2_30_59_28]|nr:hypothetical protein [Armatimonadota bacterium]OIO90939.1 MAG: hypothetical protein AUJ92_17565 [Armatimonadetes bacterium CG2_30_59_28]
MRPPSTPAKVTRYALLTALAIVVQAPNGDAATGTVTWTGPSVGGDWNTPSNWSSGAIPGSTDDVSIPVGVEVAHSGGSHSILSIACNGKLIISGGSLDIASNSQCSDLDLTGGTLSGVGLLDVSGTLTWTSGTMSGSGVTTIPAGATLNISGNTDRLFQSRTINNLGTTTWTGTGRILGEYGAVFNNQSGGVFDIQNDVEFQSNYSTQPTFNNAGTLKKSAGTGTSTFSVKVNNTGTVVAQTGTLEFAGGYSQTLGDTLLNGGNIASSNPINIRGGNLSGTGTVTGDVVSSAHVAPGGSAGALTILGNYTQNTAGYLDIQLGGTVPGSEYDQLIVSGRANLDGDLDVSALGTYLPNDGDTFLILTFASRNGDFASKNGLLLAPGKPLAPSYGASGLSLVMNSDTTPPTVSSSTADDSEKATITFSEAVEGTDATNLPNFSVESPTGTPVSMANVSLSHDSASFTTTITGLTLVAGNSYKVGAVNVKDLQGNSIVDNNSTNVSTGIVADVVGPVIVSCEADNNHVGIVFQSDESGFDAATFSDTTNYRLLSPAGSATEIALSGTGALFDATTGRLNLGPVALHNGDSYQIEVKNVKDAAGNAIANDGSANVCSGTVALTTGALLSFAGGDGQTGNAGEQLPEPFKVQVLAPTGGATDSIAGRGLFGVPQVDVTFTVNQGGGGLSLTPLGPVVQEPLAVRTNADGLAQVFLTLGALGGENTVESTASAIPNSGVLFTAKARYPEPSLISLGAAPDRAPQGGRSTITAIVTDPGGNAFPDAPLLFEVIAGDGVLAGGTSRSTESIGQRAVVRTGENGIAEIDLTNVSFGSNVVRVSQFEQPRSETRYAEPVTIEIIGVMGLQLLPGLNLIGLPFSFENPDPATVLGVSAGRIPMAGWDETAGSGAGDYVIYNGGNLQFAPGRGFWIRQSAASTFGIDSGTPVNPSEPFPIWIGYGYQLIANPYTREMTWNLDDIRVRVNGVDQGTLRQTSLDSELLEPNGWLWNASTQSYNLLFDRSLISRVPAHLAANMQSVLPVTAGAWFLSNTAHTELVLPAIPSTSTAGDLTSASNRSSDIGPDSWFVDLNASVSSAGRSAGAAVHPSCSKVFGVLDSSSFGKRGLRVRNAPPVGPLSTQEGMVDLAFVGSRGEALAWDVRSPRDFRGGQEATTWRFLITTDIPDAEVTLTYPNLAAIPKEFRLYLIDETTGTKRALRTTTAYAFRSNPNGVTRRTFRIDATRAAGARLRIVDLSTSDQGARGSGSSIRIRFSLSQVAQAQLRIRTASGRVMYEFPVAELRAGLNTAQWDGRNALGAYVPRGVYVIELIVRNDLGEEVKAVRTVRVQ